MLGWNMGDDTALNLPEVPIHNRLDRLIFELVKIRIGQAGFLQYIDGPVVRCDVRLVTERFFAIVKFIISG